MRFSASYAYVVVLPSPSALLRRLPTGSYVYAATWPSLSLTLTSRFSVEPFHLFRYLDEQAFRYNNRKMTDGDRFDIVVRQIVGKRLTWDQLTGKVADERARVNEEGIF
jgi:hypothetical protein